MFSRFEIEDMSLNHTSVTLDLDLPALLALQGGLIPVLGQKQPHFLSGTAVSCAGTQDGKLNHPAGIILKRSTARMLCPFSSRAEISLIGGSFLSVHVAVGVFSATVPAA